MEATKPLTICDIWDIPYIGMFSGTMKDAGTVILTTIRTSESKALTKVKLFFFGYGEQEERIVKGAWKRSKDV